MNEKLTVEELVKTLRGCTCHVSGCDKCQLKYMPPCLCMDELNRQSADELESLAAENKGLRENNESRKQTEEAALKKLKAALEENTRLAEQLSVKSEQLESLRTIFYEVTGSIPSKAPRPVPLPKTPKEVNNENSL